MAGKLFTKLQVTQQHDLGGRATQFDEPTFHAVNALAIFWTATSVAQWARRLA